MTTVDWESWLAQWNRELLERLDLTQYNAFIEPDITSDVLAAGFLGYPGATEDQIAHLEARLGLPLPPSYRAFLAVSNGFRQPGVIVPRLLTSTEVEWFHVRNQDTIDTWVTGLERSLREAPHILESEPDPFERYLSTALEISAYETVGTAIYLLNPKSIAPDGEWEALYFAHWVPGAERYPSFWELMQAEREGFLSIGGEGFEQK
jgi:hypothetical protein